MLTTSTIQQRCMYIQIFWNLYISTIQCTNPTNPTQSTNTDTDRYRTTDLQAPAVWSQALYHRSTGTGRTSQLSNPPEPELQRPQRFAGWSGESICSSKSLMYAQLKKRAATQDAYRVTIRLRYCFQESSWVNWNVWRPGWFTDMKHQTGFQAECESN